MRRNKGKHPQIIKRVESAALKNAVLRHSTGHEKELEVKKEHHDIFPANMTHG